jgi:hypothetical protein
VRFPVAALALAVIVGAANAEPVTVATTPLSGFQTFGGDTEFGPLSWRGGLVLSSPEKRFGGFSGLVVGADCASLLAVSDAGNWFSAELSFDGEQLAGIGKAELAPILDAKGNPPRSKVKNDAEALASLGNGAYLVAFESYPRIGKFNIGRDGLGARFELVKSPKAITSGPANGEIESVGRFSEGPWRDHYLAISENNLTPEGDIKAWIWRSAKTTAFSIRGHGDYRITDAAILPGGDILILQRSFRTLPAMALARIASADIKVGEAVAPRLLYEAMAPFHAVDNMEGLALCQRGEELRVTLISDDNFNTTLQRTLLLQFAYRP